MQFAVALEIEQSLRMVSANTYVAKTKTIGRQIASIVVEDNVVPADLFEIARHEFQTFVHVTNVATYGTLLTKELGIYDKQELELIAVGGLLHDLGKRHIPRMILTKSGALSKQDWEIIRQHTQRGYEELCKRE